MNRISDFFYSKANWITCIFFTGIMILYASLVLASQSACFQEQLSEGIKVLGLKTGYSFEYALTLFQSLNEDGLQCYRKFISIWDNIFPILYATMYIFWLSFILKDTTIQKFKLINLFPIIPGGLDWLENYFELKLVAYYITANDLQISIVETASFFSQLKWIGSSINYFIIFASIVVLLRQKFKN